MAPRLSVGGSAAVALHPLSVHPRTRIHGAVCDAAFVHIVTNSDNLFTSGTRQKLELQAMRPPIKKQKAPAVDPLAGEARARAQARRRARGERASGCVLVELPPHIVRV